MLLNVWSDILTRSFQEIWLGVASFVPSLIVAIIIFVIGWVVAVLLGRVVMQVIDALKIDHALKSAGVGDLVGRAGFHLHSGKFLGELVKWFVIVIFLVATLEVVGLSQVNGFLQEVVLAYLPRVIAAALILIIAAIIGEATQKLVVGTAKAAQITSSAFLGGLAKWAIWIFAILIALSQLGVANFFAQTLFTGVVVALSIAFGLAYGLGGQEAAARSLERLQKDISSR